MSVPSWANYAGLKAPMCVVCCTPPPVPQECACALLIPPAPEASDPFSHYDAASSALIATVGDCLVYAIPDIHGDPFGTTQIIDTISADASILGTLVIHEEVSQLTEPPSPLMWVSLNLKAGSVLTISWDYSDNGSPGDIIGVGSLYRCLGESVENVFAGTSSGSLSFSPVTEEGEYLLAFVIRNGATDNTTASLDATISSDDTLTVNPVIALWDDGGTTRQLEACPRLTIPDPLSSVSAYADETEASTALDDYTSNCVGFSAFPAAIFDAYSFVATDGGTSISLVFSGSLVFPGAITTPQNALYGSVNAEGGETISFDWVFATSGNHGGPGGSVEFRVYDNEGVLVDSTTIFTSDSDSGTWVSVALPFSGRYTVFAQAVSNYVAIGSGDIADISLSLDVSSSGALTVNPIVALYANGDNCPSRLECNPLP